jgi:hypothetical protein
MSVLALLALCLVGTAASLYRVDLGYCSSSYGSFTNTAQTQCLSNPDVFSGAKLIFKECSIGNGGSMSFYQCNSCSSFVGSSNCPYFTTVVHKDSSGSAVCYGSTTNPNFFAYFA